MWTVNADSRLASYEILNLPWQPQLWHAISSDWMQSLDSSGKSKIWEPINLLKPTGYVKHHQFNIQQFYALPTLYLCVLYLSQNKERLVPLTA